MSSSDVDDGTLVTSVATVVKPHCWTAQPTRNRFGATTLPRRQLSRPGLFSTEKFYYAKKDSHLAILCERCGLFTAVRNDAWSVQTTNGLYPRR